MLKKLDIYILKQFISKFILSLLSFLVIFILVDIIDRLDKFIDSGIPQKEIVNYYFLHSPGSLV